MGVPLPAAAADGSSVEIQVTVTANGTDLKQSVAMSICREKTTSVRLQFRGLPPRREPYMLSCTAALAGAAPAIASAAAEMYWLPPSPYGGSTVLLDTATDKLVVAAAGRHGSAGGAGHRAFFPIGYYTNWGGYLDGNFSRLRDIKAAGFTVVHPIPDAGPANASWGSGNSLQRFAAFMDACHAVGLWVMYDMRHNYRSPSDLAAQVRAFRTHPALLLWYTADEPDGHNDPTNATLVAYRAIMALDGYHPVSMTPNCANYFFAQYASGADIIVPDIYPVGNNLSFSTVYGTACNRTYGCCGCDNCPGTLADLGTRVTEMREYTRWTGSRKAFWGVAQAFGNAEFWSRVPTGREVVRMCETAVAAGASGLLFWSAPTVDDIWLHTSQLASRLNPGSATGAEGGSEGGREAEEAKGGEGGRNRERTEL